MIRFATPIILASLLAMGGYQTTGAQEKPATPESLKAEIEALKAAKLANLTDTGTGLLSRLTATTSSWTRDRIRPFSMTIRATR